MINNTARLLVLLFCWLFLTLDSISLLSSVTVLFVVTLLTTMLKANIWYLLCLKLITLLTTEFPSFYSIYLDTHVLIWCTTILFLVPILPQKQSVVEKCNYIDWYHKIRWDKQNRVTLHKTIYQNYEPRCHRILHIYKKD